MRTLSDTHLRILREEYPAMSVENDSDIERYFDMRKQGRQADALALYNNRLKKKYPDPGIREKLLSYYRSKDPRFVILHHECLTQLADKLLSRTTYIIDLLTKDIDSLDFTDAYSVIRLCEGLLTIISPDRYQAIAFTEKYARYARLLGHRESPMERTAELIRLYVTDTLESVQDLKRTHEERRKEKARSLVQAKKAAPGFDLSKITFSPQDVQSIVIPEEIRRTEDIVIAHCLKYWHRAFDASFEKTITLYSRKYHTKHAQIFAVIQNGREHHWKDEEILNAVLANVVNGYYYSISGDLYLQRTWARYKDSVQTNAPAQGVASPVPTLPPPSALTTPASKPKDKKEKTVRKATTPDKGAKNGLKVKKGGLKERKDSTAHRNKATQVRLSKPKTHVTPFKATAPGKAFSPNSIADILKANTGKTYTVYKELFFKGIRPSIRTELSSSREGKAGFFSQKQNAAEEIIYTFLYEHYNNPYQNWKESEEKKKVGELGFSVPEIEPIILRWISQSER